MPFNGIIVNFHHRQFAGHPIGANSYMENKSNPEKRRIYNIGVFAHVDAGKTTLTEQLLCICGVLRSAGSVDSGTAQTDWLDVERDRGISVRAAAACFDYGDHRINLIDTPGHADFAGEAERALAVIDGAVLLISAVEGVQSHTEVLWTALDRLGLPTIIFINKIDRAGSDVNRVLNSIHERLTSHILMCSAVTGEGDRDCMVTSMENNEELALALGELREDIADRYLSGNLPSKDELISVAVGEVHARRLTPVLCGSAKLGVGVRELIDSVTVWLPDSSLRGCDELSGMVFKIEHDRDIGKIAHVRLFGGRIKCRDRINTGAAEDNGSKVTQIRRFTGSRFIDTGELEAGDIAALCGLPGLKSGDIIGIAEERCERFRREISIARPYLTVGVHTTDKAPDAVTRLINALTELSEEEPYLHCRWEKSSAEVQLDITGEIQLEITDALLRSRYGITVEFTPPAVIYRETILRSGEGFAAYTMPKPCWAIVNLQLEPLPLGSGVIYDSGNVPHNQLFYKYQTHIKTSFYECLEQGLSGWEVTDIKATLKGGEHHTIHTHPLDFFVATPMAFMDGLTRCGTKLLEPLIKMRITAPEEYLGRVTGDIILMRGGFDTPVIGGGSFTLDAIVPVSESLGYQTKLTSATSGRAVISIVFSGYADCPEGLSKTTPRRGVDPRDASKWILYARGAMRDGI